MILWVRNLGRTQLGDSSVTHSSTGVSEALSWQLDWSGGSRMASYISCVLVGQLEDWAQLGPSLYSQSLSRWSFQKGSHISYVADQSSKSKCFKKT